MCVQRFFPSNRNLLASNDRRCFLYKKKEKNKKRRLLYLSMTLSPKKKRICHHNLAALHLKYFVGTINEWGNRFFLLLFKSFKQCEIIWPSRAIMWILFRMYVSTSQSIKINLISILSPGKGSISNGSYFKFKIPNRNFNHFLVDWSVQSVFEAIFFVDERFCFNTLRI